MDTKEATTFDQFSLSHSNAHLAKKTLVEYVSNKENPVQFKARALDHKMFEHDPSTPHKPKHVIETTPFVFKTDERLKNRAPSE